MAATGSPTPAFAEGGIDTLLEWVDRNERRTEILRPAPLFGLAATLDRASDLDKRAGAAIPPLWHWLYFLPQSLQGEMGADGHPRRGGFLPPVPLPRRMWAGGRLQFGRDLRIGDEIERSSTILKVDAKPGKSGRLVFVTVRHEYSDALGVALTEEQDIVYRDHPTPERGVSMPLAAPVDEAFSRLVTPDPVLLFRYSALTFNAHRIHYDRPYASDVEGYPGLVVQGPLIATLLVDLLHRELPAARLRTFSFKALNPLFDTQSFTLCGRPQIGGMSLWARDAQGHLAMQAQASYLSE